MPLDSPLRLDIDIHVGWSKMISEVTPVGGAENLTIGRPVCRILSALKPSLFESLGLLASLFVLLRRGLDFWSFFKDLAR